MSGLYRGTPGLSIGQGLWQNAPGLWGGISGFNDSSTPNALSAPQQLLGANASDVTLLFMTDSTGDANSEWIYLVSGDLAAEYTRYTVLYYLWGTTDYAAPVTISTGSGPHTLHIYNCALSGSTLDNFMGGLFAAAVANLSPDFICIAHGENYTGLSDYVLRGRFSGPLNQIMVAQPGVPIAMVLQNPRRDDDLMAQVVGQITLIAQERGDIKLLDVYAQFIFYNKAASLYTDNVHPNAAGEALYRQVWNAAWNAARAASFTADPAWTAMAGTNILVNGSFAAFAGATPDNWTKTGNGALTKDVTIVYPGSAYSVKIVNGSSATNLSQTVSAVPYRGLKVTLWAQIYIEVAANLNSGRFRLFDNGAGTPLIAINPGAVGLGGWRDLCIASYTVPNDATSLGTFIYANSSNSTAGTIYLNKVGLFEGSVPLGVV